MNLNRPIIQCDLNGNEINRFRNVKSAARVLCIRNKLIISHLKGESSNVQGKWTFSFAEAKPAISVFPPATTEETRGVRGDLSQSSDRWLSPFERILNHRR